VNLLTDKDIYPTAEKNRENALFFTFFPIFHVGVFSIGTGVLKKYCYNASRWRYLIGVILFHLGLGEGMPDRTAG
jgi:hypothetical protein